MSYRTCKSIKPKLHMIIALCVSFSIVVLMVSRLERYSRTDLRYSNSFVNNCPHGWDRFYPYPNLPLYCTHWHNAETSSTYTSNSLHLLSSHLHYHHPISMVLFLGCSSHCCHYGSNLALSRRPNMNPNYSQNFPKGFIQTSHTVLGLLWIVGGSHSDI